jgi:hypothetical protein
MNPRGYETIDYEIIKDFWIGHNWTAVPIELLPITGIVIQKEDHIYCAAWLYVDQTAPIGWMEWIVTNPENTPRESLKSIDMVVKEILRLAVICELKVLMTSVNNEGLVKLYEKNEFKPSDTNMTNMMRFL